MTKVLVLLLMTLFANNELQQIRNLYSQVATSPEKIEAFIQLMENQNGKNATIMAYKGAASTLISKKTKDKEERRKRFIDGVQLIESAISKEPENMEIRLIRLSVQENIPKALNYSKNIDEDIAIIKQQLNSSKDKALKDFVNQYIKKSKSFSKLNSES